MPTAGVGIVKSGTTPAATSTFQSFYAHSGRWNTELTKPKEYPVIGFNPFMPTAGVGIRKQD